MKNQEQKKNIFNSASPSMFSLDKTSPFAPVSFPQRRKPEVPQKIINDFDSALIIENIDKTAKNKAVKINLKINALEKECTKITEQIELLQLLGLEKDKKMLEKLLKFKVQLEAQLTQLKNERRKFGFYYTMSAFFSEKFKLDFEKIDINKIKNFANKAIETSKKYYEFLSSAIKSLEEATSTFKG